jgi:acyl-CoA thioester hydrolase
MEPLINRTSYRVRYADTDQMGVMYYGNYARLYEIGRSEMIRESGMAYRELEESGVVMPVYSVEARYLSSLRYDELVTIETTVSELPAARMTFDHRIYSQDGKLAHEARVVLVFLDARSSRPVRAPAKLLTLLEQASGG